MALVASSQSNMALKLFSSKLYKIISRPFPSKKKIPILPALRFSNSKSWSLYHPYSHPLMELQALVSVWDTTFGPFAEGSQRQGARILKPTSGVNTGDSRLRLSSGRKTRTREDLRSVHRRFPRFPPSLVFGSEAEDARRPDDASIGEE